MNDNLPRNTESLDIEMQVIGEIFCNEDAAIHAFESLGYNDFGNSFCRLTYKITKQRFENSLDYDAWSVASEYPEKENIKLLRDILQNFVSSENYKEHIRIVKQESMRRAMFELSADAELFSYERHSIAEMQTFVSNKLELFSDDGIRTSSTAEEGFAYFLEHLNEKREYLKTGLIALDKALKVSKGDYIIIGARPSVGKTAFALQVAWNMSFSHKVVFYSFETSITKIYDRIVSQASSVNFGNIVNGKTDSADEENIRKAMQVAKGSRLKVIEASGMTVPEIQASAVREKADIIFIDYLGLIQIADDGFVSSYESITKISKDLHTMAQKRKIAVVALCQLNRGGNDEPSLTSLRDSGQIEQDADAVILISKSTERDKYGEENVRLFNIAKNKEGECGKTEMYFDGNRQKFIALERNKTE